MSQRSCLPLLLFPPSLLDGKLAVAMPQLNGVKFPLVGCCVTEISIKLGLILNRFMKVPTEE
jgi:hypothetical protein